MKHVLPSDEVWVEGWIKHIDETCRDPELFAGEALSFCTWIDITLDTRPDRQSIITEIKAHSRYHELSRKVQNAFGSSLETCLCD